MLSFYESGSSFMFSCGFGYLALLLYYSIFWLIINIVGLIYYWRKGTLAKAFKILLAFVAASVFIFLSVPVYEKVENSRENLREQKIKEINFG